MKNIKKYRMAVYLVLFTFILSCSSMSKKDWQSLQGRNFYFQKFLLVKKGINDKIAFETMKSFPVDKILALLAHKYNITIDSSEYADFITSDSVPEYEDTSIVSILRSDYNWKSDIKNPNSIELDYYSQTDINSINETIKYKITFNVNGKEKEAIYRDLFTTESTIEYFAKGIGYSRVNPKSDDVYVNNETRSQIDLTKVVFTAQIKTPDKNIHEKNKIISEETIKQDIKKYINKMSAGNKKKFRDNIIKFLYAEIE